VRDPEPLCSGQAIRLGLAIGKLAGEPVKPLGLRLQTRALLLELGLCYSDLRRALVVLRHGYLARVTQEQLRELLSERFDLDPEHRRVYDLPSSLARVSGLPRGE
jgi:hypothetical protein